MVVYRPHRGTLAEAMAEAREFENVEQMNAHIVRSWQGAIQPEDIVVQEKRIEDDRINWDGVHMVCVKRLGKEDYIQQYGTAQCIGMCSFGYKK